MMTMKLHLVLLTQQLDRTINLPNASGTVFLQEDTDNSVITGKTTITSGDVTPTNDELLLSDADAGVLKRVTVNNLISSSWWTDCCIADLSPELGGDLDVVTFDIVSASNRNIDILPNGSGVVNLDGDGSSGGVSISDGLIDIRTGTGNVSKVKFYCESSNAHAQTLQHNHTLLVVVRF